MIKDEIIIGVFLLVIGIVIGLYILTPLVNHTSFKIYTNQDIIESLNIDINIHNKAEVFEHVFLNLANEVNVYPTENYYYWYFYAEGKLIKGNIRLEQIERDNGYFYFGYYFDELDSNNRIITNTQFMKLNEKNNVILSKKDYKTYSIQYKNKKIIFHLNEIIYSEPKIQLKKNEKYIAHIFDESGLGFHLIFKEDVNALFYYLDNEKISEFQEIDENIYLETRTEFVFYKDELKRKILIGVKHENIKENNYYDGPFDQLADNIEYKPYILAMYPSIIKDTDIDKYGHYLEINNARVGIVPYICYLTTNELLDKIQGCKETDNFYKCILEKSG